MRSGNLNSGPSLFVQKGPNRDELVENDSCEPASVSQVGQYRARLDQYNYGKCIQTAFCTFRH